MKVFLFALFACGLTVLTSANKCNGLEKKFEDCLKKGFQPKKLEGCDVGDGKLGKKDKKKCGRLENVVIKKCDYSCNSNDNDNDNDNDKDNDKGGKKEEFVPDPNAEYSLKKVGGPADGLLTSILSNSKRNWHSWFVSLGERDIPWKITEAKCSCTNACNCKVFKFGFRARVSCCQYMNFALASHYEKRSNGDGRAIVHETPHVAKDEQWAIEPAKGGYKLKKPEGDHAGKYLIAGEKRDDSTWWVDLTDDSSAATLWDIVKH